MKTTISTIANRTIVAIAVIIMGLNFASCSSTDAEPTNPSGSTDQVTAATITFKYSVPEELLKYAEITICRNNNEGTDASWEPMLDTEYTVTYSITKFPVTAPVIAVYDFTNRSAYGVNVDWTIKMDTEVTMQVGSKIQTRTNSEVYTITGDAGKGLENLMKNVLDRTFAVKVAKTGNVQFVR